MVRSRSIFPGAVSAFVVGLALVARTAVASERDLIGYNALAARPGALVANGAGVPVAQVEVFPPGTANYSPDTANAIYAGKTFTYKAGASGVSSHAGQVADLFYGNTHSPAPGVSSVVLYSADYFIDSLLRTGNTKRAPGGVGAQVVNNSWIAAFANDASNVDALRRLDDLIVRDDLLVFNGVSNNAADPFPKLLASSYNAIAVGSLSGSRGPFTFDAPGARIKPDLVVDTGITSNSTGLASGAGALLRSELKARGIPAGELAIKAAMMAGAHRDANWHHGRLSGADNVTAPLDFQQGAGQLRVDHAFDVLTAGKGTAGGAIDADAGWDYARTPRRSGDEVTYRMHVDRALPDWAAVLTWNRTIAGLKDGKYGTAATVADMELSLYLNKRGGRRLIARSDSPNDNVEVLTVAGLGPGDYQLVLGTDVRTYYGLGWFAEGEVASGSAMPAVSIAESSTVNFASSAFSAGAVPEPSSVALLVPLAALLGRRRRRDGIVMRTAGSPDIMVKQ